MMNFPPFPTQSLYGSFPSFPVGYVSIPNILDLPSYIFSVTAYYGNPFNYPYKTPPMIASWNIPYPNLLGIPQWIAEIFDYALGWVAAFFLWLVQVIVIGMVLALDYVINTLSLAVNDTVTEIESISSRAGIFSPIVAALLMGMLLVALIAGIFALANLLKALGGAAE